MTGEQLLKILLELSKEELQRPVWTCDSDSYCNALTEVEVQKTGISIYLCFGERA